MLSCYLILGALGTRPHAEVVTILWYVAAFFGGLVTMVTIATMATNAVKRRSYV